ncbi:helix-turn-helix transcriptional regulator [Diaphorobacter sp. J5-51]|uniref:helix-turn-helix domain-containing protein n=1 Tax=Diaphorobacter sp. J5-51 TaxID=680496 RepID=UPI000642B2F2|nr:helix-turn-helix transcriptional regulator [Diaphorobacter sp. J5-51]KLR57299.1 hypothetical protein OX89_13205 [Diaphorobacter sp. J5-51]
MQPNPSAPSDESACAPLAQALRDKGWTVRDAAEYLGVSRQRLYSVFADPARPRLWGCAVAGMPACTPEIKLALKTGRKAKPKPAPAPPRPVAEQRPEFEVGDVVMATKYAGIAEEGEEGVIAALRGAQVNLELLVQMPDGEDWFPVKDFHACFATTGRQQKGAEFN